MSTLSQAITKYKGQFPVPIIGIAHDLGLEIYETEDFSDDESGSIRKEGGKYVIYVNKRHAPTRKRFTIAHEVAHFAKHRQHLDTVAEHVDDTHQFIGREAVLMRSDGRVLTEKEKTMESEANRIAAEILMPEEEFQKVWAESTSIEEVAEKFFVSPSAATVRAERLYGQFLM